jgi:hypothetical protein
MIAASSLAFPGNKTLALWWSQLATFRPLQLWVGHLFVHRLDVLAQLVLAKKVDPLHLLLLRAMAAEEEALANEANSQAAPSFLERLDRRLHLSPGVIGRLLDALSGENLVAMASAERPHPTASAPLAALTEAGRQALAQGYYPRRNWQRRELAFVERLRPDGSRLLPPHFLSLAGSPGQRWQPDPDAHFDLAWLRHAACQPAAWKESFAFAAEIDGIADPHDDRPEPPSWRRIVVDRPERLLVAIVAVGAETSKPEKILVFGALQDGWELRCDQPIGTLAWSGRQEFPDLAEPPYWAKAWQDWGHAREFPPAEVQACKLTPIGHRLELAPPVSLHARLVGKGNLLKADTWLLAGDGYVRSAANVCLKSARF